MTVALWAAAAYLRPRHRPPARQHRHRHRPLPDSRPATCRRRTMRRRSRSSARSAASTISSKRRCARPSRSTIRATRSCSARRPRAIRSSALVQSLIAEHPQVPARLLIGDERISANPEAQQRAQGLARRRQRSDRDGRQQRADAARLPAAAACDLAARHRHGVGAAGRQPSAGILGADGMRLPQHLPGALAVHRRHDRARLRAGQDAVLSPQRYRGRRRLARARRRSGRGRGVDQDHARQRAAACGWSMRRSSSRSASARAATSGTGRCAGRGCGATASAPSIASRSPPAPCCRSLAVVFIAVATGHSVIAACALLLGVWYGAEMLLAAAAGWHLPLLYPAARDAARRCCCRCCGSKAGAKPASSGAATP